MREAITSDTNSQLVWKTGEAEHLPKEKLSVVSRLTGYVLMGFIHPEDLAREINENLGIDKRIAASIAEPINKKVFQPLRDELEKIYAPATEGDGQAMTPQPVLMDSISSFGAAPDKSGQVSSLDVARDKSPQVEKIIKPGLVSSAPKFFQTGQIPKPTAASPIPAPKSATQPIPAAPAAAMSSPSTSSGQAAPFMLHTESKSQPLSPSKSGFKIGLSEEQFGKMEQKWAAPPRPAQIETSFVPQPKPASPNRPASFAEQGRIESVVRVVHYNEMKTPIAPTPKDKSVLPPQTIKTVPLPPAPPVPGRVEAPAPGKIVIPVPKPPMSDKSKQAPPQKSFEPVKQKEMLPGKPEEKELSGPYKT